MSSPTTLILRPDALGDLVLFSPTLNALAEAAEGTRHVVLVRHSYLDFARRLAPKAEWMSTSLDPFVSGPNGVGGANAHRAELDRLRAAVAALDPDLVVAACPRRSWLDAVLMKAAPRARWVVFGSAEEDPFFRVPARLVLGASLASLRVELAPFGSGTADWERNFGLADYLLSKAIPRTPPAYRPDAAARGAADEILRGLGLLPGAFLVCAAAGFAHVRIKTWPAERFAAVLREAGMPVLLVGQHGEREHLAAIADRIAGARVWTGGERDLGLLAGILRSASRCLGSDTGILHLAAAVGIPVVGIFGGGTWPRFVPAAGQGAALVNPLPCFGCGWDCPFGDAPCVQAVGADDVLSALAASSSPFAIRELEAIAPETAAIMGGAARLAQERTAAHREREEKLQEIAFLAEEKDGEIRALKSAADEKDREIRALKSAADEKDVEIAALAREHEARIAVIAGLERACAERLELIQRLDRDLKRLAGQG